MSEVEMKVAELIRQRGERKRFAAKDIAEEAALCRQTVYSVIRRLNACGWDIRGEVGYGFVVYQAR